MEDKIELIKKIKALVDRGVYGEKANAEILYKRLLVKYGIDESQFLDDKQETRLVKYKNVHQQLMIQIIAMVCGRDRSVFVSNYNRKTGYIVDMTMSEFIETEALYNHYSKEYDRQRKIFEHAFIQTNNLFPKEPPAKDDSQDFEITDEIKEMLEMSRSIKKSNYYKQLEK